MSKTKKKYLFEFSKDLNPMENPQQYLIQNVVRNFLPATLDLDLVAERVGIKMSVSAELNMDDSGVFIVIEN